MTTTESYLAVFQDDQIRSYRAFLHARRSVRPTEEYREPTDAEWREFQQHFHVRELELGECGPPTCPLLDARSRAWVAEQR